MDKHKLKIKFHKSSSPNYESVIKLSKQFDTFKQDDKTNEIILDMPELHKKRVLLHNILGYITSWKYTLLSFDDEQIDGLYIRILSQILECSNEYKKAFNKETHCYLDKQFIEGWHCKYISEIKRHLPDYIWDYNKNYSKYWFDFGKFDKESNWVIDKDSLLANILNEVGVKKIYVCPYYKQVMKILQWGCLV